MKTSVRHNRLSQQAASPSIHARASVSQILDDFSASYWSLWGSWVVFMVIVAGVSASELRTLLVAGGGRSLGRTRSFVE